MNSTGIKSHNSGGNNNTIYSEITTSMHEGGDQSISEDFQSSSQALKKIGHSASLDDLNQVKPNKFKIIKVKKKVNVSSMMSQY